MARKIGTSIEKKGEPVRDDEIRELRILLIGLEGISIKRWPKNERKIVVCWVCVTFKTAQDIFGQDVIIRNLNLEHPSPSFLKI